MKFFFFRNLLNFETKNLLLFALIVFFCLRFPLEGRLFSHDLSVEAALEYWTMKGYQYGTQIIPNTGPLGFIHYPEVYSGFLTKEKFLICLTLTSIFVGIAIFLAGKIPNAYARKIFLINVALFSHVTTVPASDAKLDTSFYLLMLCVGYCVFLCRTPFVLALFPILSVLSLAKGTLMLVAACINIIAVIHFVNSREYARAILAPAIYALSFVVLWVLSGQNLENLPIYIDNMIGWHNGYAVGYLEAMAMFEHPGITALGGVVFFCALANILKRALNRSTFSSLHTLIQRGCVMSLEIMILFIVWKHSFVRAGQGHIEIFFSYCIVAIPLLFWLPVAQTTYVVKESTENTFRGVVYIHYIAIFFCIAYQMLQCFILVIPPVFPNIYALLNPQYVVRKTYEDLEEIKYQNNLPLTQAMVGKDSIGLFGNVFTPMIYNNFNFYTMPRIVPFASWNHATMELDANFYRNPETAPRYILYSQATIDNNLSGQASALAQLEIFSAYSPVSNPTVLFEHPDHILLKRNVEKTSPFTEKIADIKNVSMGKWVSTPDNDLPIRLKVFITPSVLTKVLEVFYKPPEYYMEIKLDDGSGRTRRIIPISMREGVMIAPYLRKNIDVVNAFYQDDYQNFISKRPSSLQKIVEFRIGCKYLSFACSSNFNVEFESILGLSFGTLKRDKGLR